MTLRFKAREVYGRVLYYPACDGSRAILEAAGTKTLTARQLDIFRAHKGFTVIVTSDLDKPGASSG